jgi:CRISPR/Cas system-associated endoribonuclease Cas2
MDSDFEIFEGKSFKSLCKDIVENQEGRKEQIELLITELRPLIKTVNDAMVVVPLIKQYMDAANQNDDHIVRLAAIIQKLITSRNETAANNGTDMGYISEADKEQLFKEVRTLQSDQKASIQIIKNI